MSQEELKLENKLQALKAKKEKGEEILPEEKIKVAVLADSPNVVTGFGNVCREVLGALHETGFYDFEIVGINYDGSPHDLPYKIWPAMNALIPDPAYRDVYGRQKFLDLLGSGRFDLAWVLQDSFIIAEGLGEKIAETNAALPEDKKFQFIFYFPIDAVPRKQWIDKSAMLADFPIVYTRYGYNEIMKLYHVDEETKLEPEEQEKNKVDYEVMEKKLQILYHGCNTSDFNVVTDERRVELKEKYWDVHKDKFVFINVNRNQPRKDIFRTMQAFKILLDRRRAKGKDDVYLYLHCSILDNTLFLVDMAKQLGLVEGDEFAYPDPKSFGPSSGFPISVVNDLYNSADAVVTTTLGEGWGLSLTEGMAVKKPVIAPDHTSITEILGKVGDTMNAERGFLVKTDQLFVQQNDNSRARPITDPEDMADKMEWVLENQDKVKPIVDAAYQWVKELDWKGEKVGQRWVEIFEEAYDRVLQYRAVSIDKAVAEHLKKQNLGRNDICPVCNIKYKKCRHGQD